MRTNRGAPSQPPRVSVSSTICPFRIRRIRWARELTSASCVTSTTVCPASRFRRTRRSMIWVDVSESRFPVGSSAHTIAGSFTRARAIATRCCWPALSWAGLWSAHPSSSTATRRASAFLRASRAGTFATRSGNSTFSAAVSTGNRLYDWNTNPIRRERYRLFALSSIEASETPSMRTSPEVRSSRPEKQFRSVVLPHPDGPMIATISPRGIARFTPRSAWTLTAPELYTLWASTPRIIGSTFMRIVSMSRGIFRVSLRVSLGARDEQVQRPGVLDAGRGRERLQTNCEFLVECLAAFRGHLTKLSLIPSVRSREGDEFRHVREPDRERLRRRVPLLETCDAERPEDRTWVSECLRLRIRSDKPHRLPHLREILRRRSRPVLLEQFPQRGERRVRIGRPLAEDEPSRGFQDAMDLLEHAVVAKRRDPEVADHGVEELAMVDDVPRVEHLEPDVPDARVPGRVRGDGDRAVRQVDRDDALREDARRDLAREKPGSCADVEEQLSLFRVREPDDLLGDRLEPRGHVLVVRLRHPAVLVDPHEGRLVRVHRGGANRVNAIRLRVTFGRVYARPKVQLTVAELVPRFKEEQVFIVQAFLVHSFRESGRKGVVLGLSGGVDSALVAKLCADALGPQHVLAVAMPDGRGGKDLKDAKKFAKALGIDFRIIGVAPIVTSLEKRLLGFPADQVDRGNPRGPARVIGLYFIGNQEGRIVMGTGNKSELLSGYFCYDSSTRAITSQGPKFYWELRPGDTVFSINLESGKLVEAPLESVHVFDYKGEMVKLEGRRLDLLVTPNHRMLIQLNHGRGGLAFKAIGSRTLQGSTTLPIPGAWDGLVSAPAVIDTGSFLGDLKLSSNAHPPVQMNTHDFLYLMGLFIGDGCASTAKTTAPAKSELCVEERLSFRGKDGRLLEVPSSGPGMRTRLSRRIFVASTIGKRSRGPLLDVLRRSRIHAVERPTLVAFTNRALFAALETCGVGAKNKRIPQWVLKLPALDLSHLYRGLMDSDGNADHSGYTTISQVLAF